MYPYLQSYTKIGFIFGITHTRVRRAVLNDYTPPDDITEDYDYVGRDFKKEYPALSANGHSADKRPRSPELDDISESRPKRRQVAPPPQTLVPQKMPVVGPPVRPVIKVPQEIPVVEVPVRPKAVDPGAAVKSFLKNVGGFDLSHWQDTFKAKGLHTMGDLKTLASLEESRLVKTLTRLFADKKMAELHIILLADALLDLAKDVA
ncbi:hypothetical protein K438DRAFT_1280959 [Mycena galopus ATCC 62051]|nr:hypothetical protein K438DRAFT_1280959 [Mycena galopus ATCC 62051]